MTRLGNWRPRRLPRTPSLQGWRHLLLVWTKALLLFCNVLMTSTQKTKSSIKTTRRKNEWKIIMRMITLLILNMMIRTLMIDVAYVTTVEVWVATTDVRCTIIWMLSVRLNLKYLLSMVSMTLMHTLLGRLRLTKSLHVMNFLRILVLGLLLVSLPTLLLFCG